MAERPSGLGKEEEASWMVVHSRRRKVGPRRSLLLALPDSRRPKAIPSLGRLPVLSALDFLAVPCQMKVLLPRKVLAQLPCSIRGGGDSKTVNSAS